MKHRLLAIVFLLLTGFHFVFGQEEISLEVAVAIALEKNYDVQILKKVSEAAETDKGYSWAAFLPRITATGARVWNENFQKLRVRDRESNEIVTIEGDIASNN